MTGQLSEIAVIPGRLDAVEDAGGRRVAIPADAEPVAVGLPGVSYLTAMDLLARQHASTFAAVLVVLAWNVIMLLLLEGPIVAYRFAPEGTAKAVESFKSWLTRDEGRIAYWCTLIAGAALLAIGVVHLVS